MVFSLILLFELTLIYLAFTERVKRFLTILMIQGLLLFGIAYLQLKHINILYLAFILSETIIVKGLLVPLFLNQMRKRNNLDRLAHSKVSTFVTVMAISAAIVFGFLLSSNIHDDHLQTKFLAASIAAIITGIYFVMIHRNIFTHLVGYLITENGVFCFHLRLEAKCPCW